MRALAIVLVAGCALPAPRYSGPVSIDITQPLPGVAISVVVEANEIWHLTIRNDGDDPVLVMWDESALVGPDGSSWGRMMSTGIADTTTPHQPSPVAPHSALTEAIVPSRYLELPWAPPSLAGVRLLVALRRGDDRLTWQAIVPR